MAEVLLFHHAQGLTPGVEAFAGELRGAGHVVHSPDLYEGQIFADLDRGVDHAEKIGFETVIERAERVAGGLGDHLVYAGFSLGVLPAQKLALTRPGARGALLFSSCVPSSVFDSLWPDSVPVQVHAMEADEFFVSEGDLEAARALTSGHDDRELFLYEGDRHLFADASLPAYDEVAAGVMMRRVLDFLSDVG